MNRTLRGLAYMTAEEMQATVESLTGVRHPGFEEFASVLGTYDAQSGSRTNDRPTLLSILFLQKIGPAIAALVVERERFLDDAERLVFRGVDFDRVLGEEELKRVVEGVLGHLGLPVHLVAELCAGFRAAGEKGWEWLLGVLLQHGGLYYV